MRLVASIAFAGITGLIAAGSATAMDGQDAGSVVGHIFSIADTDGSGTLTRAEYGDAGLERYGVSFDASDANGDGETSVSEYLELYERHHPREAGTEL